MELALSLVTMIIFVGTFSNPKRADYACGFSGEKQARIKEMLLLQNVDG